MPTVTLQLPHDISEWIEARVRSGRFASADDYLHELVARDRDDNASDEERIDSLKRLVEEAEASGVSDKSIQDIKLEAEDLARQRGWL